MLKRKIENKLNKWKNKQDHKPLVIKGCRQCGKTTSVLSFAKRHYKSIVYINFFENPLYKTIFNGSLHVDNLISKMSAALPEKIVFIPNETVIILDEIQECPQARTSLKFFHLDKRFDIVATGSLLGISGYKEEASSIPVGYETIIEMFPLDFEEFLWANNIGDVIISLLKNSLENETPIEQTLHLRMRELFLQYAVIGGMPDAVAQFIKNKNYQEVLQIQRDIVRSYKDDMIKYAAHKDKALIRQCFESIPKQLSKENKKFQYSVIKKGSTASRFAGCLQWIEDAGIILRCNNLFIPQLPLSGNSNDEIFKIYISDSGLFISMLDDGTQYDILQGNLYGYKGAIFENLIAETFGKMSRKLYYYKKDSGLEIDFVIRYKGKCTPVEIKAKNGNAKSMKTILKNTDKYHIEQGLKLIDSNIGRNGNLLSVPHYLAFLLTEVN